MTVKDLDIITIGESLIECLHKYYGGDSLVVATAASRLGSKVGFVTCLGDDAFKDYMLSSWQNEGLDVSHAKIVNEKNGIYLVSRAQGEQKEFIYYRKKIAPAKLSIEDIDEEYIKSAKVIYASGITQSLSLAAREVVKKAFEIAKENNILTAYDPNYTSMISTQEDAKEYFHEIIPNRVLGKYCKSNIGHGRRDNSHKIKRAQGISYTQSGQRRFCSFLYRSRS